jgi:hypothetical protein
VPLNEAQTQSLTTAMVADQQRQRQDAQSMARTPPPNPADPDYRAKMQEYTLKRVEDDNRRLLEVAAPHLNARQLAAYREQMEQQSTMNRMSMLMELERARLQPQPQPAAQIR